MVQVNPKDLFAASAVVPQLSAETIYCASSKMSGKHKPHPNMYK